MSALSDKMARYLMARGQSAEAVSALQNGQALGITGPALEGWIIRSFKDGIRHSKRSLADALLPQINALISAAEAVGRVQGYDEAKGEVIKAEALSDRLHDELAELRRSMSNLQAIDDRAPAFQAIVADCLLWFDGFAAAHSPKESWERPHVPDRERLRTLNAALQGLLPADLSPDDQDIPF